MKRVIKCDTNNIPLGDYSTRSNDRRDNATYWQLRAQQTDDMDDIKYFANSPEYFDRYYVTQNPNTPEEILRKLMKDKESIIRNAAKTQLETELSKGKPYWSNDGVGPAFDYRYYVLTDDGEIVQNIPQSAYPPSDNAHPDAYRSDVDDSTDYEEDPYETDAFRTMEDDILNDLGLYVDWSSVRGDYGTIWIFSDPNHENNADMWMGDLDDALAKLDYSEYRDGLYYEVFSYPKRQWKKKYRNYVLSLIDNE